MSLRSDWQKQLKVAREKCGFERVRFHGIFDDDMSVYQEDAKGNTVYSFFNVDQSYDYLLSLGIRPLVELSFMPELLASYPNETIMHYKGGISPPKSYDKWANLIKAFVTHLIERYGFPEISQWDFEVWNEPNCDFWTGNQKDYYKLLKVTYDAIKSVDKRLKVGGPATCQLMWIPETLQFASDNNMQLDFISSHIYPTDWGSDNVPRDVMIQRISTARYQTGKTPLYITEYNSGLYCCNHDTPYASAFVIWNIPKLTQQADILSYWTFSDIFEEWPFKSAPFTSGFGMQTIYGTAKPVFRAFELLHRAGHARYDIPTENLSPNVGFLCTTNSSHLQLLVSNWNTLGSKDLKNETFQISFFGVTSSYSGTLERIDETHANPQAAWIKMGSPTYPTPQQIAIMDHASLLVPEPIHASEAGAYVITIPPYGVVALTLPITT